jgi:hypothetical protein
MCSGFFGILEGCLMNEGGGVLDPSHRLWGHAATFGASWAALEVTVGSFAHAIKLPFAGVVLAGIGAAWLIALRTICPRPGVVLAAGLVCAGVKLLSPAGAVVGPIIGIMTEALFAELVLMPLGVRLFTAPLVGALACSFALTQKVITQWVLYGAPILNIYLEILDRAEAWMGLPRQGGLGIAFLFLGVVASIGALLGLFGRRIGQKALFHLGDGTDDP